MTRINLVHPSTLADQHLFAEWREIKMVPAALRRSLRTRSIESILKSIPKNFCLNSGHVLFFYDKLKFLRNRYDDLTKELVLRNYDLGVHDGDQIFFENVPEVFQANTSWSPTINDVSISIERILLRLNQKLHWYKYNSKPVSPGFFEEMYGNVVNSGSGN